jgi:hypothetical protein
MAKVIYIAGYGRSGSTVLDIVLSGHHQIAGLGEVSLLVEDWSHPERRCSCGAAYPECPFWRDLFPEGKPDPRLARVNRQVEQASSVPRLLLGRLDRTATGLYRAYQDRLFQHVLERTGATIIVDSSKSARQTLGRLLALQRIAGHDVYVLHLVRNGLATMESLVVTGSNWVHEGYMAPPKYPGLRAVAGWVSANLGVLVLRRFVAADRYMLLRYEDFVKAPAESLARIGEWAGFDAGELVERVKSTEAFDVEHHVGGNRVRLQQKVVLQTNTKPRGPSKLTLRHQRLFRLAGGWLNVLLGYR